MIITEDNPAHIQFVKGILYQQFEMKELGHLCYFLGTEVAYDSRGYLMSQQKYTADFISRAEIYDNTTTYTPMRLHHKLIPDMSEPLANPTHYVSWLVLSYILLSPYQTLLMLVYYQSIC